MLPEELAPRTHREVRLLAVQPPDDVPGRSLYPVDTEGVPAGDQQVSAAVTGLGDRVDVEVVVRRGARPVAGVTAIADLLERLSQRHVRITLRPAVPLPQQAARGDVDLLSHS